MPRVLVVDDDPTVSEVVARYLTSSGFAVDTAGDGTTALEQVAANPPDLVVLDLLLPGIDGLEVCRRLRERSSVPVVMLTALGEESDRVLGLETGADDYVTKPFSPRELVLRVQSVLRRAATVTGAAPVAAPATLQLGDLVVDLTAREARRGDRTLSLTLREFDLLEFLLRHPRTAFTRAELLEKVWGWTFGDQSTVTVHVRRLREKIEADPSQPSVLVTVWGVGYRLEPPDVAA
ncbi:MAG TPA: response regulator transcription factor [Frankiaceae bacterium]|nr:response regulator transcription factor [Frankiaceae bacterium]